MRTYVPKKGDIEPRWFIIDAEGLVLGRLATEVARILRGKHKATFAPHMDMGDHVVIVNAEKVVFKGNKLQDKMYRHHTGFPGGLKEVSARDLMERHPERVLEQAVKGMLPKNKLGRAMAKKLKVYVGPNHPHEAQKPVPLE